MRVKFFDRLLVAISGLILFFLGAGVFVFGTGIFSFKLDISFFARELALWERLVVAGVALLLLALGIHSFSILFRKRKDKGFIMQHTDLGDVSISMYAMEGMVKRCVDTHEELKVTHTRIQRVREGVVVDIRLSLANGVNIPLTVNALQKQIKHYITSCSGVDVKEVRVMVETNSSQKPKGAEVVAPDLVAAEASVAAHNVQLTEDFGSFSQETEEKEAEKEPIHQRIFKREEHEMVVPPPPEEENAAEAELPEQEADTEEPASEAEETPDAEKSEAIPTEEETVEAGWLESEMVAEPMAEGEEEKENE